MKITVTTEIDVQPATVLVDTDGDRWILLDDGCLHQVNQIGGAHAPTSAQDQFGPMSIWPLDGGTVERMTVQ